LEQGGVYDAVAGVEEEFGGREGFEVGGSGGEDAVVEVVVAGGVARKAAGDGGGPEDEPVLFGGVVIEGGSPGVEGGRFVGEDVELLMIAPVNEIGGGGVADDGGAVP